MRITLDIDTKELLELNNTKRLGHKKETLIEEIKESGKTYKELRELGINHRTIKGGVSYIEKEGLYYNVKEITEYVLARLR